jgi:hypothetical protein
MDHSTIEYLKGFGLSIEIRCCAKASSQEPFNTHNCDP